MIRSLLVAALLPIGAAAAPAIRADRLPSELGDRVAGKPVNCIDRFNIDKVFVVAGVGLLYEMRTGTRFLNRPTTGLTFLHDGVTPLVESGPRLCSVELVRLLNNNSRVQVGAVSLGAFVPYRRPGSTRTD